MDIKFFTQVHYTKQEKSCLDVLKELIALSDHGILPALQCSYMHGKQSKHTPYSAILSKLGKVVTYV